MSTTPEPVTPDPRKVPQAALVGGGVLLVLGVALIVLALLRSGGGDSSDDRVLNLTSPGATTTPASVLVTSSARATPSATATKKASPPKAKPTTPAAKPKPKATKTPAKKTAIKAAPNTPYLLRNVITGLCVGITANDVALAQADCGSTKKLVLEPTRAVNGAQLYRLRDTGGTDQCFDVPNLESEPAGAAVGSSNCNDPSTIDNEEWTLGNTGRTSKDRVVYTVVNFKSGNCLDVFGNASDQGDRPAGQGLTIFTCKDANGSLDDHVWTFG
jgi:hypothetical protein